MITRIMELTTLLENPFGQIIFFGLMAWSLAWKGVALWKSARNYQIKWFIALLLLNTIGILEIIYIFYFSKAKTSDSLDSTLPK